MPSSLEPDRLIDSKELKSYVPYSRTHIGRLEARGQFPRRIHIGEKRIGWSLREILLWIENKKRERRGCYGQTTPE